jgi:hypothetical protein
MVAWSEAVVVTGRAAAAGSLGLMVGIDAVVVVVDALGRSGSAGRPGVAG